MDLSTDYLGLGLPSPVVASSSPLTADLDCLRRLEDSGAGAVVLPSLFEEQNGDFAMGSEPYLELIRTAKQALEIPVIGSLNGTTVGDWLEHARLIEEAGADALELSVYMVVADPALGPRVVEERHLELVAEVRRKITIPLAVKPGPYFTAFAHTAAGLVASGADGLVLFNRFSQPEIDLEALRVSPHLMLSHPDELGLPLRWIGILHGRLGVSLAGTTGVHSAAEVLQLLLAGADVAMMASALLEHGPTHLSRVERDLREWLEEHEYDSIRRLQGSVSRSTAAEPAAFERADHLETPQSAAGTYLV